MIKLRLTKKKINKRIIIVGLVWVIMILATGLIIGFEKLHQTDLTLYSLIAFTLIMGFVVKINLYKKDDFGILNIGDEDLNIETENGIILKDFKDIKIKIIGYYKQPISGVRNDVNSPTENHGANQAVLGGNENQLILLEKSGTKHRLNFFLESAEESKIVKNIFQRWQERNLLKLTIVR